jgi:(p)ppGpp synthase/HD superfamily hydrolase
MEDDIIKERVSVQKVIRAKKFAERVHGDQMYGDRPYTFHTNMVASLAKSYGEEAMILGHLHDILEDTEAKEEEIIDEFGARMLQLVCLISDCKGINRKERKLKTNEKLSKIPEEFSVVLIDKVCDRAANVFNCIRDNNKGLFEMYKKEHPEFKKAVYRPGLCDPLWDMLDTYIETESIN